MKNWIKAFLLISSPLLALNLRCADWEVGAAALYWRPCTPAFEFAQFSSGQKKELFSVDPDYNWGARVWVGYTTEDGCNFGRLDWTWVRISDAKEAKRNTLEIIGFDSLDRAKGRLRHVYNRANLRLGHRFYSGCNVNLFAYAGGRFVDIERREKISTIEGTLKNSSQYTGGGIELGVLGQYELGCGFKLVGNLSVLTILGRQKTDVREWVENNFRETLKLIDRTQCVAGWDVRAGINYTYQCFRVALVGELGYEVNYYLDPLAIYPGQFSTSVAQASGDSRTRTINQGFGGPYASLMIRF